jgi:hypothetical protein
MVKVIQDPAVDKQTLLSVASHQYIQKHRKNVESRKKLLSVILSQQRQLSRRANSHHTNSPHTNSPHTNSHHTNSHHTNSHHTNSHHTNSHHTNSHHTKSNAASAEKASAEKSYTEKALAERVLSEKACTEEACTEEACTEEACTEEASNNEHMNTGSTPVKKHQLNASKGHNNAISNTTSDFPICSNAKENLKTIQEISDMIMERKQMAAHCYLRACHMRLMRDVKNQAQ